MATVGLRGPRRVLEVGNNTAPPFFLFSERTYRSAVGMLGDLPLGRPSLSSG